ncbi:hypothetical protein FQA39_LY08569 [Lamprigera yunnana]|nr:hypothetical protein FQA39_LY08569 [Lamprigera yunnana]
MPPLARVPARNVRKKKDKLDQIKEESIIRDSDVQIQKNVFAACSLDESSDESQPARCTRARTNAMQKERTTETTDSESPSESLNLYSNTKKKNKNDRDMSHPLKMNCNLENTNLEKLKSKNRIEKVSKKLKKTCLEVTLNPDGNWPYSLQSCIEQFMQQYSDEIMNMTYLNSTNVD